MVRLPAAVAAGAVAIAALAGCSDGDDEAAFCEQLASTASVDVALERFDPLDPAGTAATFAAAADRLDRLADAAPSEVEDAARVVADAVAEVESALRVVHRDDPNAAVAALDLLSDRSGELAAAGAELEAYATDRCGTTLTPGPTLPGTTPTTVPGGTATTVPGGTATTTPATVTAPTTATTGASRTTGTTTPPPPSEG